MTNWIESLAEEAKKENWCVKWGCTTCGSTVFKSNLTKRCFQNNNIPFPSIIKTRNKFRLNISTTKNYEPSDKPFIIDLLPADIEFCVKAICKELATLSSEDINQIDSGTLHVIFGEIYGRNYIKLIKNTLGDSSAGKYLISMEAHSKYVDEQYRKHEINNDPKMLEEKRRIKKELKAKAHVERVAKYKRFSFIKKYWFKLKKTTKK